MFLRSQLRKQDGKEHTYWSAVENQRLHDGRVVQRQGLYLGEVNDSQRAAWRRPSKPTPPAATRPPRSPSSPTTAPHPPMTSASCASVWTNSPCGVAPMGGCWLALELYRQLGLDTFFAAHLPASRKGTRWDQILQVLGTQRLLAPGSEWHLHRDWFERTALTDLLGRGAHPLAHDQQRPKSDRLLGQSFPGIVQGLASPLKQFALPALPECRN